MNNNNQSQTSLEEMLQKASKKLGTNSNELKTAISNGKINDLLENLGTKESQKIAQMISDKKTASQILSTPKAQQLLKKLLGGK